LNDRVRDTRLRRVKRTAIVSIKIRATFIAKARIKC
jgi:hypothetical protein